MKSNNVRCAPLCQHPGCWESNRTGAPGARHNQYSSYLQELLRLRCSSAETARTDGEEKGLSVLTVQSLAMEGVNTHDSAGIATITASKNTHPPSSPPPHPPQLHSVEVLLEAVKSSPASSLSFSPVLIWRPGRFPAKLPSTLLARRLQRQGTSDGRVNVTMNTQNLTDALPPERSSRRKARLHNARPHSRLHSDSLDFLQDMPPHIVNEILHQLRSESSSTVHPFTSPCHHSHQIHTPTSTQHTSDERAHFPDLCHVPSSLMCDLSTGQLYRKVPDHIPTRVTTSLHTRTPLPPPQGRAKSATSVGGQRTTLTLHKKTSFSRELSRSPLSVLRKTVPAALHNHRDQLTSIHMITAHQTLLPTALPPPSHIPPSNPPHNHSIRFPIGNPLVPRTPHEHHPNPLLAPYHSQLTRDRGTKGPENSLHVCPAYVRNARLVTLHCFDSLANPKVQLTAPSTLSEETVAAPQLGLKRTVHLPPIPSSHSGTPCSSPSPPLVLAPSSPDHMHVGAEIRGDQLVLERGGEQVVHPLKDTSQASMSRTNRPEATPSMEHVASGTQAPPPAARQSNYTVTVLKHPVWPV